LINFKTMKIKYLLPILFLFFVGCEKALIEELPSDITKVEPVENVVDSLKSIISEDGNVQARYPYLFSDTIQKNIVLDKESNVYVTFIDDDTDGKNTLCWYSYNKLQPPLSIADIKGNVLFPNISKTGEGGLLELGYTVQLGTEKFPSGTVIGFFLIVSGWRDGVIDYDNLTNYTNYNFNVGQEQLHVLFKNGYSRYVIMGFEDNLNGPHDFNDILFAVSDNSAGNEATSFDLSEVILK